MSDSAMLWISLVADLLPTAASESICRAFNSIGGNFDLIGVISAFGTSAATKSLKYSALNDSRFYATGHVGPGGLSVAAALYQATEFPLARLLAFSGSAEDTDSLAKLSSTDGLHYIGLKSNTECTLLNAVGGSIVQEHKFLWRAPVKPQENHANGLTSVKVNQANGFVQAPPPKRPTTVIVLKAEEPENPVEVVSLEAPKGGALTLGWLPLALTIAVIVSCCFCDQWFVAGLILLGTLSMMIAVLALRNFCHLKYYQVKLQEDGLPDGDILVADDSDPDVLNVVKGTERTIQKLFQRDIDFVADTGGKQILFVAASMLYIYVLGSVLHMTNASTSGQIHFAIANLIGIVADIWKASLNGKLGLAKKALEEFGIKPYRDLEPLLFDNRTEAIAFVAAAYANDPSMLKSKKLLPSDGPPWEEWWARLAQKCPRQNAPADAKLFAMLKTSMDKGLAQVERCK